MTEENSNGILEEETNNSPNKWSEWANYIDNNVRLLISESSEGDRDNAHY